jgi:hypothetical protein
MTKVAVKEAQERLPELLEKAANTAEGADFVVELDDGTTVLVEVKKVEKPRPVFGSAKGKIKMKDEFFEPLEDFKDYMQ